MFAAHLVLFVAGLALFGVGIGLLSGLAAGVSIIAGVLLMLGALPY